MGILIQSKLKEIGTVGRVLVVCQTQKLQIGVTVLLALVACFGQGQAVSSYRDLHDFLANDLYALADGCGPVATVTFDADGNMFGTTLRGGPNETGLGGTLWEITSKGVYKNLHNFGGTVLGSNGKERPDGSWPHAAVTVDAGGNIYGTTSAGGLEGADGTVWELSSSGVYSVLHDFMGQIVNADGTVGPDGRDPVSSVAFDLRGNKYGTASLGGPNAFGDGETTGAGMIWEITKEGEYRDIHDFGGSATLLGKGSVVDGISPLAGVTFDKVGNMFGTACYGGIYTTTFTLGSGVCWEIPVGGKYTVVHQFTGGTEGSAPSSPITIMGTDNLYSTTSASGNGFTRGGTVWEYTESGKFETLHTFGGTVTNSNGESGPDGYWPLGNLGLDGAGNLYGTTSGGGERSTGPGGNFDAGMIWQITTNGTYHDLHDFGYGIPFTDGYGGTDGVACFGGLTVDKLGNI